MEEAKDYDSLLKDAITLLRLLQNLTPMDRSFILGLATGKQKDQSGEVTKGA